MVVSILCPLSKFSYGENQDNFLKISKTFRPSHAVIDDDSVSPLLLKFRYESNATILGKKQHKKIRKTDKNRKNLFITTPPALYLLNDFIPKK